jgi:hypothetical protein
MPRQTYDTTLMELVEAVQDQAHSDEEAVAVIAHMLNSRRLRVVDTFAGQWMYQALAV